MLTADDFHGLLDYGAALFGNLL